MADYNNDQYLWEHGILKGHELHGCAWDGGGDRPCPNDLREQRVREAGVGDHGGKVSQEERRAAYQRIVEARRGVQYREEGPSLEDILDDLRQRDAVDDETNPKDLVGIKKAAVHLVPPALRLLAAPAMADGAEKYGAYNWREKSVKLSVYLAAAQRHIDAYWDGEELAEDSKIEHLSHAAACLAIIADARAIGKLVDDRPVAGGAPQLLREQDRSRE